MESLKTFAFFASNNNMRLFGGFNANGAGNAWNQERKATFADGPLY